MIRDEDPPRFPWRYPHRLRLLADGDEFLPAMLDAIRQAQDYVLFEMYLVESGATAHAFAEAMTDAVRRGVRVFALLDDFGCRALPEEDRDRFVAAGIALAIYNPLRFGRLHANLHRDHRKLLLVDGRVAFVGGAGITDEFNPDVGGYHWHEFMLRIEGPCVGDWHRLFARTWKEWSASPLPDPPEPPPLAGPGPRGRVVGDALPGSGDVLSSANAQFKKAKSRLWIATAYFVPTRRLRRILIHAAQRGVDVRLLVPGEKSDHPAVWHAGRRFYGQLLRHGVRIYEFAPRFLHAKLFLCDDWVAVGSCNLDHWTLRWNIEAQQEIVDADFADEVSRILAADFAHSRSWDHASWQRRGLVASLLEQAWGTLDALLVWLSYRGRITQGRKRPRPD